jgi:hypothetical protein
VALTDQEVLDDYNAWNPPTPPSTGTYTQSDYQFYLLYQDQNGNMTKLPGVDVSPNMPISVPTGAQLTLEIQTNCDNVANCDPLGHVLQFDVNSSANWAAVSDSCVSKVCFYGSTDLNARLPNGVPTCPLSGALTCVDGGTQRVAAAVPVVDLGQNNSTVNRYLIKAQPDTTDVIRLRLINQNGNPIDTYSQYPTLTGIGPRAGVGF